MTTEQLHEILDNHYCKLTKRELAQVLYELKTDTMNKYMECNHSNGRAEALMEEFYLGESNAFQIALDLLEHLEDNISAKEVLHKVEGILHTHRGTGPAEEYVYYAIPVDKLLKKLKSSIYESEDTQ